MEVNGIEISQYFGLPWKVEEEDDSHRIWESVSSSNACDACVFPYLPIRACIGLGKFSTRHALVKLSY